MMTRLPNLELIEYKAKELLYNDEKFKQKLEEEKKKRYCYPEFELIVFPQVWGSTCTGFDLTADGRPAIAGSAITKEYTTVVHEIVTDTYLVFFGNCICYSVTNANEIFLNDLNDRNMKSLSRAKTCY